MTSADDAWIPLVGLPGWIAHHHPALTEEQIAAAEDWLKARAPTGFRLGPPIPLAWLSRPMMAEAGKYLDLQWAAGAAIVRTGRPQPGSPLAQLREALAVLHYTGPLPEGLAAVANVLGVRPPNVDALLAMDGKWVVVELHVSLIEQAIAAAAPDPPPAPLAVETAATAAESSKNTGTEPPPTTESPTLAATPPGPELTPGVTAAQPKREWQPGDAPKNHPERIAQVLYDLHQSNEINVAARPSAYDMAAKVMRKLQRKEQVPIATFNRGLRLARKAIASSC